MNVKVINTLNGKEEEEELQWQSNSQVGRKKWKGIARIEFVRIRLKVQLHELHVASSAVELNKEKESFRVNGMLTT